MSEKPTINREISVRLQRLGAKMQTLELTLIELKEQIDAILTPLLQKINALEKENSELKKPDEKQTNPKPQK